jgi:hypothetical protein
MPMNWTIDMINIIFKLIFRIGFSFFYLFLTNYEPLIFEHKVNLDNEHWNQDFLINA